MKTYRVAVGDKEYIVKVEEVAEGTVVEEKTSSSAPVVTGSAELIEAPLQGSILAVNVKPGDTVKTGDTVLVIEAMKLENEVVAPKDGVIQQVFVEQGQTVDSEDPLYSIA